MTSSILPVSHCRWGKWYVIYSDNFIKFTQNMTFWSVEKEGGRRPVGKPVEVQQRWHSIAGVVCSWPTYDRLTNARRPAPRSPHPDNAFTSHPGSVALHLGTAPMGKPPWERHRQSTDRALNVTVLLFISRRYLAVFSVSALQATNCAQKYHQSRAAARCRKVGREASRRRQRVNCEHRADHQQPAWPPATRTVHIYRGVMTTTQEDESTVSSSRQSMSSSPANRHRTDELNKLINLFLQLHNSMYRTTV